MAIKDKVTLKVIEVEEVDTKPNKVAEEEFSRKWGIKEHSMIATTLIIHNPIDLGVEMLTIKVLHSDRAVKEGITTTIQELQLVKEQEVDYKATEIIAPKIGHLA